jgi:hypothetical protein
MSLTWITQVASKNNIHVVYMHMRLNINRILEYFLKNRNPFTNWPPLDRTSTNQNTTEVIIQKRLIYTIR